MLCLKIHSVLVYNRDCVLTFMEGDTLSVCCDWLTPPLSSRYLPNQWPLPQEQQPPVLVDTKVDTVHIPKHLHYLVADVA